MLATLLLMLCGGQDMAKQPPLIDAIDKGQVEVVRTLLHNGADPNIFEIHTSKPSLKDGESGGRQFKGNSALTLAIDRRSIPLVAMLLGCKANPNLKDEYGWTPLMTACQRRDQGIVKLLLKAGAKPNLENRYGDTAIVFAANMDSLDIVKDLVNAGADIKGGSGGGTLHTAIMSHAPTVVSYLLSKGLSPNYHQLGYATPLEVSRFQYSSDEEIEKILLKAGAKGKSARKVREESDAYVKKATEQRDAAKKAVQKAAGPEKLTEDDLAILRCALKYILESKSREFQMGGDPRPNVIIGEDISGSLGGFEDDQINSELSDKQANEVDLAMRRNFAKRNHGSVSVKGVDFNDARILLGERKDFGSSAWNYSRFEYVVKKKAKCWISPYLPGYSSDGKRAFLRFSIGPSPHGASGTFYFQKKENGWVVAWSRVAFYS